MKGTPGVSAVKVNVIEFVADTNAVTRAPASLFISSINCVTSTEGVTVDPVAVAL